MCSHLLPVYKSGFHHLQGKLKNVMEKAGHKHKRHENIKTLRSSSASRDMVSKSISINERRRSANQRARHAHVDMCSLSIALT